MKIGEIWKFKNSSITKRESFEIGEENPNDDDLFYVIYPEVLKIVGKLSEDRWEIVALYEKTEAEHKEKSFFKTFIFIPTGEAEIHEMNGEQIYKNYDLVRDENFMDNYEEGELYEMKELERDKDA